MIEISEHTLDASLLENKNIKILDLGACLGDFSHKLEDLFKISKAVLVEANPTNFNKIKKIENFIILNKAVFHDESIEYVSFNEDLDSPVNGSIIFDHFKDSMVTHKIKTTTLKELISLFDLEENEKVDILKIDIEGGEYDLLMNASKEDLLKFKQVTIEFHDFIDPSLRPLNQIIINKLESFGFILKSSKPAFFRHGSNHYDALFINEN